MPRSDHDDLSRRQSHLCARNGKCIDCGEAYEDLYRRPCPGRRPPRPTVQVMKGGPTNQGHDRAAYGGDVWDEQRRGATMLFDYEAGDENGMPHGTCPAPTPEAP